MKKIKIRRWHGLLLLLSLGMIIGFSIYRLGAENIREQKNMESSANHVAAALQPIPNSTDDFVQHTETQPVKVLDQQLKTEIAVHKTYYQNKVAVLTYHHLDPAESSVTITPERFKAHLEALANNGFHVISAEDFIDFLQKKKNVPSNAVVITFDDGYESVYRYAYPILKSEGMTATVFLIVSYIEDGTSRQPPILNWQQIMEMHHDGFSFYSHSYNSHESVMIKGKESSQLTTKLFIQSAKRLETDNEYKTRVRNDLIKADDILNGKLGNKLNLLCLPHGQYNQAVVDIANQANIPFLFTGVEGFNSGPVKLIKRINAGSPYMTDKLLITKLSVGR